MNSKQTSKAPAAPAPMSRAELNALKREEAQKMIVMDNSLRNLGQVIGENYSSEQSIKQEREKLEERVHTQMNKAVQRVARNTKTFIDQQREDEQKMNALRNKIASLKQQLEEANQELEDLKKEKERVLFEKDSVIENQKREMKEMAYQFSDMLMKTLITITEDFEAQTGDLSKDETGGLPHPERLKDFHLDRIRV